VAYNANMFHRVRYQVQYANPINYALEANKLANIIKLYNQDSDSLFVR
jgi:replication factor A1